MIGTVDIAALHDLFGEWLVHGCCWGILVGVLLFPLVRVGGLLRGFFRGGLVLGLAGTLCIGAIVRAAGGKAPSPSGGGAPMHAPALMTLPAPPLPSAEAEGDLSPSVAGLVMKEVLSNDFTIASYVHTTMQDAIRVSWTNAYTAFPGVPASRRRVEATFATDLALGDWSYLTNQVPRFPNLTSAASVDFRIPSALLPPGAGSSGFFGFAPWADPDLDFLGTLEELLIYRTDPFRRDTDGDSFSDGDEVREGMDPCDPADGNYLTGRSPEWYLDAYPGVLAAVTNADGSVSLGLADPAASNLYYTVGVCPDEYGNYESVSVSNGNGFAPDGVSFLLAEGVTNTLPLRVGQRYVFESFWPEYWKILTDDPAIVCTTNLDEMTLTVCRPFRLGLTDIPPPDDAWRCGAGHVHARYCAFTVDPDLEGTLSLYDTDCIAVDNAARTLRIARSWRTSHLPARVLRAEYGALGEYVTADGTVNAVYDDLCPHSLGAGVACVCGVNAYCPDCYDASADWYNQVFDGVLTATNAPGGSLEFTWCEGVSSNAYYWAEVSATNRAFALSVTADRPTHLGNYSVTVAAGRTVRIPLLAGVTYSLAGNGAEPLVSGLPDDAVLAHPSNRLFTVVRPLSFALAHVSALETRCPSGHVHARRHRLVPSLEGVEGTVSFADGKCFHPLGGRDFSVVCDGVPGGGCPSDGLVSGTFAYEGASLDFAIAADLCRCDDRRRSVCPCGEPTLCDGCDDTAYGQDDTWVRINFTRLQELDPALTNAEQVISEGYANWVDRQVGVGLTNGLYRFTATLAETPDAPVVLTVGDETVCATNAGAYVFLLEKGVRYPIRVEAASMDFAFEASDDLSDVRPDALPQEGTTLLADDGGLTGHWSEDGGMVTLYNPLLERLGLYIGAVTYYPRLYVTPADWAVDGAGDARNFTAVLCDAPDRLSRTWSWQGDPEYVGITGGWRTSATVTCRKVPGEILDMSLRCAVDFGGERLVSLFTQYVYGASDELTLEMPDTIFINNDDDDEDGREDNYAPCTWDDDVVIGKVRLRSRNPGPGTLGIGDSRWIDIFERKTAWNESYVTPIGSEWSHHEAVGSGLVFEFAANGALVSSAYRDDSVSVRWTPDDAHPERTATAVYTVVEPVVEPIFSKMTNVVENGVAVSCPLNPAGVAVGELAYFSMGLAPDSYPDSRIVWSADVPGLVEFVGGNTGRSVCVRGLAKGVCHLVIRIGGSVSPPPNFPIHVVDKTTVKLSAWIVADENGATSWSEDRVRQCVKESNDIFRQVGVSLNLSSVIVTNIHRASKISYNGSSRIHPSFRSIVDIASGTGGLELYCVEAWEDYDERNTLGIHSPSGIVVVARADSVTVAHELGHAFNMDDIYTSSKTSSLRGDIFIQGHAYDDWSGNDGCGKTSRYYRSGLRLESVIARLLMNGRESKETNDDGIDISTGDVKGFWYSRSDNVEIWHSPYDEDAVPVGIGFFDIRVNRHPQHL